MLTEAVTLRAGEAAARIDAGSFGCVSLSAGGWSVLGDGGMRVMFPWVGLQAARPARLRVGGATVAIGGGSADGLAGGGWRVGRVDDGSIEAELLTKPGEAYPFQVRLRARWRLDLEGLRIELEVSNGARVHAPFGLGVRASLAPLAEQVELLVPAEEVWTDAAAVPIRSEVDFRRPRALSEQLSGRFTRRHFANLQTQLGVLARGREVWLNTSADFREADVAIGQDGSGHLESATCIPDAFAQHAQGIASGLRVLAPGESWRGHALLVAISRLHSPATGDSRG